MDWDTPLEYLPELKRWFIRKPLFVRALIVVVSVLLVVLLPLLRDSFSEIGLFLSTSYSVALPVFVWITLISVLAGAIVFLARKKTQRSVSLQFIEIWDAHASVLFEMVNIDGLLHPPELKMVSLKLSEDEQRKWDARFMECVLRCHETRAKVTFLLNKIGEDRLCRYPSIEKWRWFLKNTPALNGPGYKTPFSFLTDFVNPISFINHRYKEFGGEASYIADCLVTDIKNSLFSQKQRYKEIESFTERFSKRLSRNNS